jgi:hypothetical protein
VLPHGGSTASANAVGLDDLPVSEMLPDSSPYKPGDFYLFNDGVVRRAALHLYSSACQWLCIVAWLCGSLE